MFYPALIRRVENWCAVLGRSLFSLLACPFVYKCHIISTIYPLAPTTYETVLSYHNYRGNDIIDNDMKSSIFAEVDGLLTRKDAGPSDH